MAVNKRTRFEVLRRDDFTCRYCRSTEGQLTIDHVLPVALGGTDAPDNLVTACRDCNAGKSSTNPGSPLVAQVTEETLRYAERARQAWAVLVEEQGSREEYVDLIADELGAMTVPVDWRQSIARWFSMGVHVEVLVDCARQASANAGYFRDDGQFRYFCKLAWTQVRRVNGAVAKRDALDGAWRTDEDLSAAKSDAWMAGHKSGLHRGCTEHLPDLVLEDFVDRGKLQPRYVVADLFPKSEAA